MVERSTEGLHSHIKRILSRARRASTSYLSLELRFPQLVMHAVDDPAGFKQVETDCAPLCSLKGFRHAILQLDTACLLLTLYFGVFMFTVSCHMSQSSILALIEAHAKESFETEIHKYS